MKVAIIGSGNVGSAIARAAKDAGHEVTVANLEGTASLDALGKELGVATTNSNAEAVGESDLIVLAVPFGAVESIVGGIADQVGNKIVLDITNPLKDDLSGVQTEGTSGAELVQKQLPQARVVKAFNTVLAGNQANPMVDGVQLDGFVAGDDPDAKEQVSHLLEEVGYRPIDVGPLSNARYLEGMAFLNIWLNAKNNWSWQSGWKLVGPLS
ncbi:MAG TPA: NADPH-dependent F420 reductase [Actinomycetota bacterium]